MKNEKTLNYTSDINWLIRKHQNKLSRKLAHLLCLTLLQNPHIRHLMVEEIIKNDFGFIFSDSGKVYHDKFKDTMRSVIKNALTNNYSEEQVQKHLVGYVLTISNMDEMQTLRYHFMASRSAESAPPRNKTPHLNKFIDECLELQKKFIAIDGYHEKTAGDLAISSILASTLFGKDGKKDVILLPALLAFGIILLLEAYLFISNFVSTNTDDNALIAPLLATFVFVDIIATMIICKTAYKLVDHSLTRNEQATKTAKESFLNKLPDLITAKVEVEVEKQNLYSYSLPLFQNSPVSSIATGATPSHEAAVAAQKPARVKTRPSFFSGLFKASTATTELKCRANNDTLHLNDVAYHRLYNKDNMPTDIFIGYTEEDLHHHTTEENRTTFKTLLDYPCVVPPKDKQGFVLMKDKRDDETLLPFKLKILNDARLLFSLESNAKLDNENIKLYRLSSSVRHNQFARLGRK